VASLLLLWSRFALHASKNDEPVLNADEPKINDESSSLEYKVDDVMAFCQIGNCLFIYLFRNRTFKYGC
jgi:hypothetical protein